MRLSTAVTALLAATFAVSSPTVAGGAVQIAERADVGSIGDLASHLETIKGLVDQDFSGSNLPSASQVTDITGRINDLVQGLVPVNLDLITGGDLLDLLGVLNNLGDIVGALTRNLGNGGLQTRQLSYAPIINVLYPLLTSVSQLISEVLTTVYGAVGSSAARDDAGITEKLLSGTSNLSRDTGSLFSLLNGLGGLGDLLPVRN